MSVKFWDSVCKVLSKISLFNIEDEELNYLLCGICSRVMVNASQLDCGCKFCRQCIEKHLNNENKYCPMKISDECSLILVNGLDDIHSETGCNKIILKLLLKCPERDCVVERELKSLVVHWQECHEDNTEVLSVEALEENDLSKNKMLNEECHKVNAEVLSVEVSEQSQQNGESKKKVTNMDLRNKIVVLKKKKKKLEKVIEEMNERITCLEKEKMIEVQTVYRLQFSVNSLEEKLSDVKYDPFLWKLDNFSEYKETDAGLYSDTFSLKRYGPRMRLLMYPSGVYGEDKYVAVYFEVVRGQYDAVLVWPLRINVTLSVLTRDGGRAHSHTVYYLHHRGRRYVYDRPRSSTNIGLGASNFIEYVRLTKDGESMLCDDCLYLLCEVEDAPASLAWTD